LYRTTAEILKKEKYLFVNRAGDYYGLTENDRNKLFVERIESVVSSETSKYFTIHQPEKATNLVEAKAQPPEPKPDHSAAPF
jgi:hypothetical protein